jgi:hypothetical protein
MGKRNTVVTKPTVATEPSEQHFDDMPRVLNPEAIGDPTQTPLVQLPRELAQALVDSGQCTVAKPARPRRISAEAVKAETRLANLTRAKADSVAACLAKWEEKRAAFIATLPHDVQGMLLAGGVITDDDLEGIGE